MTKLSLILLIVTVSVPAFATRKSKKELPKSICELLMVDNKLISSAMQVDSREFPEGFPVPTNELKVDAIYPADFAGNPLLREKFRGLKALYDAMTSKINGISEPLRQGLLFARVEVTRTEFKKILDQGALQTSEPVEFKILTKAQAGKTFKQLDKGKIVLLFDPIAFTAYPKYSFDYKPYNPEERFSGSTLLHLTKQLAADHQDWENYGTTVVQGPFPISLLRGIVLPDEDQSIEKDLYKRGLLEPTQMAPFVNYKGAIPKQGTKLSVPSYALREDIGIEDVIQPKEPWTNNELKLLDINTGMRTGIQVGSTLAKPGFWLSVVGSRVEAYNRHGHLIKGVIAKVSFTLTQSAAELTLLLNSDDGTVRHLNLNEDYESFNLMYRPPIRVPGKAAWSKAQLLDDETNEYFLWDVITGMLNIGEKRITVIEDI